MKFAQASYGWMFFLYKNIFFGPGKLCCSSNFCCVKRNPAINSDTCYCNVNAILHQLKIQQKDIIYASFKNRLYEVPFYIAVDHEYKAIVVAIRGTLSFQDALTDLTIESQAVDIDFDGDARAHKGILQAAYDIQKKLTDLHLLDDAFVKYPNFRLVITGHSLGAGTAALLSVLLKAQYNNLVCFSFSPPGWLVSSALSQYMQEFVLSVVIGKDIIPRLGLYSMNDLKNRLRYLIANSFQPKV
ncbi:hypothetical protein HELRODRAFT_72860 [Helobdella robusta]|uniref:sn-1-specific diacylglycerol lipase n=1 Tax=Helobdella robusta TaxID=6412 RepID=T1G163_HELRO|nr:hypothetical protein HELRODRAFT_72860 [Helobdella robusta]ESO10164.1 hypothetical protein HELRODRAFT_72860 [Helobdella robusta]